MPMKDEFFTWNKNFICSKFLSFLIKDSSKNDLISSSIVKFSKPYKSNTAVGFHGFFIIHIRWFFISFRKVFFLFLSEIVQHDLTKMFLFHVEIDAKQTEIVHLKGYHITDRHFLWEKKYKMEDLACIFCYHLV